MATPQINGSSALKGKEYRVITIPAREQRQEVKLRVAAYARVSSSSEDQLNSFAAQNRYYTDLIAGKENWQQVDIYADEGITGTSAEKRDDFQRMLADCRRGLIDRVLVKSISRFARNTKECLETIRELKLLGISVYFEKENIDTGKMSGETMTAMFAAMAQAESESISGNMRWSYRKRMQDGTFIPPSQAYGFLLLEGKINVEDIPAQDVERVFWEYLSGMNMDEIADKMKKEQRASETTKQIKWTRKAVGRILSNEKYTGDSLWQKTYRSEGLPHKYHINRGERVQYFAKGTHPQIVAHFMFDQTQQLRNKRRTTRLKRYRVVDPLRGKVVCNHCNSKFRSKTSNGIRYLSCRGHESKEIDCFVMEISESGIYDAFCRLHYKLKHSGGSIFNEMISSLQNIRNHRMLWSEDIISLNNQISNISSQNQLLAQLNQQGLVDPDIFIYQSNELAEQLRNAKLKKERLLDQNSDHTIDRTQEIMTILDNGPDFLDEFDGELFDDLIDKIIVESNEKIRFRLKNGLELTESIERTVR